MVTYMLVFCLPPFFNNDDPSNLSSVSAYIGLGFDPKVKKGWGAWFPKSRTVSDACKDFISKCLATESADRVTAADALKHAWLTEKQPNKGIRPCNAPFLNSLSCFKSKEAVTSGGHEGDDLLDLLIECGYLDAKQRKTVSKTFTRMDTDGDGLVSAVELRSSLLTVDPCITLDEARSIMNAVNAKLDKTIDYHCVLDMRLVTQEARLKKIFKQLDQDERGTLNAVELMSSINQTRGPAEQCSLDYIKTYMSGDGKRNDTQVDYESFLRMWMNKNQKGASTVSEARSRLRSLQDTNSSLLTPDKRPQANGVRRLSIPTAIKTPRRETPDIRTPSDENIPDNADASGDGGESGDGGASSPGSGKPLE